MAWQNRQVLDWMLVREGGMCHLFGQQCCTFIPNHTEPGRDFYKAMKTLGDLREELVEQSGVTQGSFTNWLEDQLGKWGVWFAKIVMILFIILMSLGLTLCCFIPCIKELCARAVAKQMTAKQLSVHVSSGRTEEERQTIRVEMKERPVHR